MEGGTTPDDVTRSLNQLRHRLAMLGTPDLIEAPAPALEHEIAALLGKLRQLRHELAEESKKWSIP